MTKIVINTINTCINFSVENYLEFCKRSNLPVFIYYTAQKEYRKQPYIYKKISEQEIHNLPKLTGIVPKYSFIDGSDRLWFLDSDEGEQFSDHRLLKYMPHVQFIDRDNSILISMVNEGKMDGLKVITIPDGVEWYIDEVPYEYDTFREIIRETHQIWE